MHTDSMKVQLVAKANWCRLTSDSVAAQWLRSWGRWWGQGACTGCSDIDACFRCTFSNFRVLSACAQMVLDQVLQPQVVDVKGTGPPMGLFLVSSLERAQRAPVAAGHAVRVTV